MRCKSYGRSMEIKESPIEFQDSFYRLPPTPERFIRKLAFLKQRYPFLEWTEAGRSVLGRRIIALSIGNTKRMTMLAGGFHAQEWLTSLLLVKELEALAGSCESPKNNEERRLRDALRERGLMFLPMVNPDGVAIALQGDRSAGTLSRQVMRIREAALNRGDFRSWQANARGVDLNHNYNAGFAALQRLERQIGITGPAPRQYSGPYPHSEPETRAVVSLLSSRYFDTMYAFHSQGEEIYWQYGDHTSARSLYLGRLLSAASGYELIENTGLCSHGGCKDYFIEKTHRPGFTIEIGRGENPLPIEMLDEIHQKTRELLKIAALM